jgi:hypothetical protein
LVLAPAAVYNKTGYALGELLKGLWPGLVQTLVILGATTGFGAAAGGVIGFFFGGAGAVPGALLGGELGLEIGTATLGWLGLGFLAAAIAIGLSELSSTVAAGVKRAWLAPDQPDREYPHQIEAAAQDLANAAGILMLLILQGIVAWVFKRAAVTATKTAFGTANSIRAAGSEAVAGEAVGAVVTQLRSSKLGGGFADWVEANWPRLRDDPRLRFKMRTPEGGGPGTETAAAPVESRAGNRDPAPKSPVLDNKGVATRFMRGNKRYKPEKIDAYLDGIDLSKPVQERPLKPGDKFVVWERAGAKPGDGSWATAPGVPPDEVGIIADGRTPVTYVVKQPMTVLESTAKSYPKGVLEGIGGSGGGQQLCLPDNWQASAQAQ